MRIVDRSEKVDHSLGCRVKEALLTIDEVLAIETLVSEWTGKGATTMNGISTDSRLLRPGEWFCAIAGERFDGHEFVPKAMARGAAGAIVNQEWFRNHPEWADRALLIVEDTLQAYQEIARHYRNKTSIPVIGITGSSGKTTCKEMVYSVLSQRFAAHCNAKSFNNHIGLPATLLTLRPNHEILVAEVGTNHFGELRRLGQILNPTVVVLTNIGFAHLEAFGSLEGVLRAKLELLESLPANGTVVFNSDDPLLSAVRYPGQTHLRYGLYPPADVRATDLSCNDTACYQFSVDDRLYRLPIAGRHNVYNALAAIAVGQFFSLSFEEIQRGLQNFVAVEKRMQIEHLGGMMLVNETYNANPSSMAAALRTLADMTLAAGGRRIAVLGDMLELGSSAVKQHQNLAEQVVDAGVEILFLYGDYTRYTAESAHRYADLKVYHFAKKEDLADHLHEIIHANDIILFKGSRGMQMESVIESLKTRKSE